MFFLKAEFWRFVLVGFINTFNYYILYLVFFNIFNINYMVSHISSFLLSMVGSFYMNSYFTYKTKPTLRKFLQFPLTYLVNITITTISLWIFVDILELNENLAPLLATVLAIPFTFALSKLILTQKDKVKL
ncbi:polysaccharide biosynthesis protein [Bacillus sp. FJAT-27225]|uniref:GtrA family protein n=1 Tax=Bacillus sp. FJAT-27225 TaxID=1743144 RepID=UPI00080C29ED|nr:GtrA family protein [Bacillus sp. FJAT-27225]OCA88376.1 polysaccharide biosynthesis protein [Bacillus sp. FJAT-27225]